MKYTLLSLVQLVLTYSDDLNVQSVGETEESEQAVSMVNQVYNDLISVYPWPHLHTITTLATTVTAHIMKLAGTSPHPTSILNINWIRYSDKDVRYITPHEMRQKLSGRDTDLSSVDTNGAINDVDPTYWTSNDDFNIIFDSYNISLASNKTEVSAETTVTSLSDDADIPNLPERFHSTLGYGCIAEAVRVYKGDNTQGAIYDRKFKDGINSMKRWAKRINQKPTTMPGDWGRKRGGFVNVPKIIEA